MRVPLIAGNWKMHGSRSSVDQLLNAMLAQGLPKAIDVAVFPPTVYLAQVATLLDGIENIAFGAQNVSEHLQGAYTGEISGDMLKDFGCKYTLVGHSERRTRYGETDSQVAEKFIAAQKAGLLPVLCVGETLAQREAGQTEAIIAQQLAAVLEKVDQQAMVNAVIAYEPVWAIGTGLSATPEQAQLVHQFIRNQLGQNVASKVQILYGGSVKAESAKALFAQTDIDGALVGGASLNAEEFMAICRIAEAVT